MVNYYVKGKSLTWVHMLKVLNLILHVYLNVATVDTVVHIL